MAQPTAYQRVTSASNYDASAGPIFIRMDGVDDALSSATFAAGTLTSSMDCLIAVRRDSYVAGVCCGLYDKNFIDDRWFAAPASGVSTNCYGLQCGSPTVWVDGTQLAGGTSVTRDTLNTALTLGAWHILELHGLNLSTWGSACFSYPGALLNGALGAIQLFASGQDANRDKARARMAAYFGVTLP